MGLPSIPGFSSGGDMAFDTGAGGNDQLSQGDKTDITGDKYSGGSGGSVNNVNFQFMPNSNGSNALDFAAGFFKNTNAKAPESVDKKYIYLGVVVGCLAVAGAFLVGRK